MPFLTQPQFDMLAEHIGGDPIPIIAHDRKRSTLTSYLAQKKLIAKIPREATRPTHTRITYRGRAAYAQHITRLTGKTP